MELLFLITDKVKQYLDNTFPLYDELMQDGKCSSKDGKWTSKEEMDYRNEEMEYPKIFLK